MKKTPTCKHWKNRMCPACCVATGNYSWCVIVKADPDSLRNMGDNIFEVSASEAKEYKKGARSGINSFKLQDKKFYMESKVPEFYPGEMFMVYSGSYHSELFGRSRRPYKSGHQVKSLEACNPKYPQEVCYMLFPASKKNAAAKIASKITMVESLGWKLKKNKYVES